jgi:hypothetical protein
MADICNFILFDYRHQWCFGPPSSGTSVPLETERLINKYRRFNLEPTQINYKYTGAMAHYEFWFV